MRRVFTLLLSFHWMTVFFLLAILSATDAGNGLPLALAALGAEQLSGFLHVYAGALSAAAAVGFGLAGVVFLWALVSAMCDRGVYPSQSDEVVRLAFSGGSMLLTLVLIAGAVLPVTGLFGGVALQLAALLCSYVVVQWERKATAADYMAEPDEVRAAARRMALGAAHNSLLSRLAGRNPVMPEGRS